MPETTTLLLILLFVMCNALAYSTYACWRDAMDWRSLYREQKRETTLWYRRANSMHDWSMKYWNYILSQPDGHKKFLAWSDEAAVILLPCEAYEEVTTSGPPPLPNPAEASGPPQPEVVPAEELTKKLERAFRRVRVERAQAAV